MDHQYLSIGEVLGLLLEDFPDVTISKIRFLESQGLIEPERTPSGYRKFYDGDVELLRAILHEQKANFLPLKVIRDRIVSGAIDADTTGGRTPPRGIRNVEPRNVEPRNIEPRPAEARDSVFRRTDGGPEWADGRALIPGDLAATLDSGTPGQPSPAPITASVPVTPAAPQMTFAPADPNDVVATKSRPPVPATVTSAEMPDPKPRPDPRPGARSDANPEIEPEAVTETGSTRQPPAAVVAGLIEPPPRPRAPGQRSQSQPARSEQPADASRSGQAAAPSSVTGITSTAVDGREMPYNPDELCQAASITAAQLATLQEFGIVASRGSGLDTSFQPDAVEIARVAGQLLAQGIDARHLRAWRQAAERESALFEQRIMPLLRQRNPQARQSALDSLSELSGLGARLHNALVDSLLQHHFDGT